MRSPALTLSILLLPACVPPGHAVGVEHIDVPSVLAFTDVVVGQRRVELLSIGNIGTASASVELTVAPPFSMGAPDVTLAPGEYQQVGIGVEVSDYAPVQVLMQFEGPFDTGEVLLALTVNPDADNDGHLAVPAGGDDCDDAHADAYENAPERCDGRDNDCDEVVDEQAVDASTWYRDVDGDSWGDPLDASVGCTKPVGYVRQVGDCADTDPLINPGALEVWYDGTDQDCSGGSDYDVDRDGHDSELHGGDDCDDDDAERHPAQIELDDWIDNDCDGLVDEDFLLRSDLVITEILVAPAAVAATLGQYVEVLNTSSRTVVLDGMSLTTSTASANLSSIVLAPDEVAVLCADTDSSVNGGVTCDDLLPATLRPDGSVTLESSIVLDEVDWTDWTLPFGRSIELAETALHADDNDVESAWCLATEAFGDGDLGTPGTVEGACP